MSTDSRSMTDSISSSATATAAPSSLSSAAAKYSSNSAADAASPQPPHHSSSSSPAPASSSSASASSHSPSPSTATGTSTDELHIRETIESFERALRTLMDNSLVEVMEALETLLVYTKNLILYPGERKYRKIKISNIHYQERLGHLGGALDAMNAIGYAPVGEYLRLDENRMSRPWSAQALRELERIVIAHLDHVKKGWADLPQRLNGAHSYSSVLAAGSYSAIGRRNNMEDDEIIVDHFCGDSSQGYFGLYDGHGGRATVDFVVKALHMNLEQHLKRNPDCSLPDAFKHSYLATDGQLRRQNILRSGTTSVTCLVRRTADSKRMLFSANVGDSRAVLCRGGKAVRLTIDHKASLPEEAKRITDGGGFIGRNKRVNGVLAISRALGDHILKENDVVSAEPYCTDTELTAEDTHILLACDGVWDVMTDQEAVDFMLEKLAVFTERARAHNVDLNPRHQAAQSSALYNPVPSNAGAGGSSAHGSTDEDSRMSPTDSANSSSTNSPLVGTSTLPASVSSSSFTSSSSASSHSPSNGGASGGGGAGGVGAGAGAGAPHSPTSDMPLDAAGQPIPRNWNDVLSLGAKSLVEEALERKSLDNVTVMIVAL